MDGEGGGIAGKTGGAMTTASDTIRHEAIPITRLFPHKRNYRSHPPEQIRQLKASLQRFSQVRSVVVADDGNERYTILAGHGVAEAALEAGLIELHCDVVPRSWSEQDRAAYLVADNLHAQNASDDEAILAALLQEQQDAGYDLSALGTDEEALRQMLEALGDEHIGGGSGGDGESDGEEDELPDEVETRAKPGDIWQLGRHKIACLDSLDPETLRTLFPESVPDMVWADPPYGISIVATNVSVGGGEAYDIPFGGVKNRPRGDVGGTASHMRKTGKPYIAERGTVGRISYGMKAVPIQEQGKYAPVIGDDTAATAIASARLCLQSFPKSIQFWWGGNYYANALPPSSCWIVWDKDNNESFFADCELAWTNQKTAVRLFKHMWNGLMKASEKGQRRVHPTQKPVKLAEWAYEKYGKEGDVIYDPFLGSGMSLIAAENLNRTVIGCELSPEYIDVIITRWENLTGQHATLLERSAEVNHV